LGFKRENIVKFSFLLAVPTMIAATGYDFVQSSHDFSKDQMGFLLVGFAVSFVVAILAIKLFLKIVRTKSLVVFGIYRIAIGAAFLLALKP
ncbi:MAG TPA: undecaprenyl-diphosphate phosphatase, partial [Candidatus Nitrosotalea sp.]|nr:undecaprenyl-diphosphate phosphatase [Candidatus Nitrosotalea sp.]